MFIEAYQRQQQTWMMTHYTQPNELIELPCLNTNISVEKIYESVDISNHQFSNEYIY
jgi:hypothetical protein